MPWHMRKSGKGYKVVGGASGRTFAKHTTKTKAKKQLRLLNAVKHGWKPTGKK